MLRTVRHELLLFVEPHDVRLGTADHLAGQTDGERHLDAAVARPHGELWRHDAIGVAAAQFVQLPVPGRRRKPNVRQRRSVNRRPVFFLFTF